MRNTLGPNNPKAIMTSLKIIFFALCIGVIFFGVASYFISMQPDQVHIDKSAENIFMIVVPIFTIASVLAGYILYRSKLQTIKDNTDLLVKCRQYQTITLIKFAMFEAPALFALVVYMLTANIVYLGIAFLIVLIFFINFPSKTKIQNDIELNVDDIV